MKLIKYLEIINSFKNIRVFITISFYNSKIKNKLYICAVKIEYNII